jgi:hypothetical protein
MQDQDLIQFGINLGRLEELWSTSIVMSHNLAEASRVELQFIKIQRSIFSEKNYSGQKKRQLIEDLKKLSRDVRKNVRAGQLKFLFCEFCFSVFVTWVIFWFI